MITVKITPIGKPRMTQRDKWAKRQVVESFFAFKKELQLLCNKNKIRIVDELSVTFQMPMPKSWNSKMKDSMRGKPHQSKPDCDNMVKAVLDSLVKEDQVVYKIQAEKYWADEGAIIFNDFINWR